MKNGVAEGVASNSHDTIAEVCYITNPIEVQHRYCYYHRIKDLLDKKEGPLRGDLIEGNQQ